MNIYTKTGDHLKTDTLTERVYKNDPLIDANGHLDELQAHLMMAYHMIEDEFIKEHILAIVHDLFIVGYDFISGQSTLSIHKVEAMEKAIDAYDQNLPPLTDFIVPGLTQASSYVHVARTIARRAERKVVNYALDHKINDVILKYLNRLSDFLFILARVIEESKKVD